MSDFEHLETESPILAKRFSGMIQVRNTSGRTIIADSKGNYLTPDSYAAVNPFDLIVIKQLNKSILTNIEFSIDENDLTEKPIVNKITKVAKNKSQMITSGGAIPPGKCCPTR
jgi:hypothetical protein